MTHVLPTVRNGVDSAQLYGSLDAIKDNPELGTFQFRASNTWIDGAHNRTSIQYFYGAGQEDRSRLQAFTVDAGAPGILLGVDTGPNPAELLLSALAADLTTTLVHVATARKVMLSHVTSTLTGDLDMRGALGLSDEVRNGFSKVRVHFDLKGDASDEQLQEIVERAQARSVVYDIVTNGVPVEITPSFTNPWSTP